MTEEIDVIYLGETILYLRVCANTEDGYVAAAAANSQLASPGTSLNEWVYDPDNEHIDPSPTVPCADKPGRWHHVLNC